MKDDSTSVAKSTVPFYSLLRLEMVSSCRSWIRRRLAATRHLLSVKPSLLLQLISSSIFPERLDVLNLQVSVSIAALCGLSMCSAFLYFRLLSSALILMVVKPRPTISRVQVRTRLLIAVNKELHVYQMAFACSNTTPQSIRALVQNRRGPLMKPAFKDAFPVRRSHPDRIWYY